MTKNPGFLGKQTVFASGRIRRRELETALELERDARIRAEAFVVESLEERKILLGEIHHRVKNNLQTILSLLRLQSGDAPDQGSREALAKAIDRIQAISMVHERLYKSSDMGSADATGYFSDLTAYLSASLRESIGGDFGFDLEIERVGLDPDRCIACGLIVSELVTNAVKHAFPSRPAAAASARISISLVAEAGSFKLCVSDNGIGMPEKAAEGRTVSLGMRIVQALVRQLKGELEVSTGPGAAFTVRFPAAVSTPVRGVPTTMGIIKRAIASLPEGSRILATRYYLEGLSAVDLGEELGFDEETTEKRLRELRVLIKDALAAVTAETARIAGAKA
jgi:two-component sensor histidine kinase